jgi:hypothetical protein
MSALADLGLVGDAVRHHRAGPHDGVHEVVLGPISLPAATTVEPCSRVPGKRVTSRPSSTVTSM